ARGPAAYYRLGFGRRDHRGAGGLDTEPDARRGAAPQRGELPADRDAVAPLVGSAPGENADGRRRLLLRKGPTMMTHTRSVVVSALIAACCGAPVLTAQTSIQRAAGSGTPVTDAAPAERDEYKIGPEDTLEISVWKNPDL